MATTRANNNIVAVSRMLKDERSSASSSDDTGHVYNSALLMEYQNRAVRELLRGYLEQVGDKVFARTVPEFIVTSGNLTLASGSVSKPADCLRVLELSKSDRSLTFFRVPDLQVESVRSGMSGTIVPTVTRPVYWEEGTKIYTLGLTSGDVIARYIKLHPDLAVITAAIGPGKIYTDNAHVTWTAATKVLSFDLDSGADPAYTSADIGKLVVFNSATDVYIGRVASVTVATHIATVTLMGDGLPAGNLTATQILAILCSDQDPDDNDLKLNSSWDGAIQQKMFEYAMSDTIAQKV